MASPALIGGGGILFAFWAVASVRDAETGCSRIASTFAGEEDLMLKPYELAMAIIIGWMIFGGSVELKTDGQPVPLHGQQIAR
jgi:hypothetical protein